MQMTATLTCHYHTVIIMANKQTLTPPSAVEGAERQELSFTAGGDAQMVQPLGKRIWQFLKRINSLLLPQI